jgi:hypothetical protein
MEAVKKRDADDLTSDDDMAAFDTSVLRNNDEVVAQHSPSKKLKVSIPTSSFADMPAVALSDEDFLAQANALFASAGMLSIKVARAFIIYNLKPIFGEPKKRSPRVHMLIFVTLFPFSQSIKY